MTWIWWAPLGAAILHIVEEFVYPGGFADWDRRYRPAIRASITPRFHVVINVALLLLCAQVGALSGLDQTPARPVLVAAWLAVVALLFSNAVFHVLGSVRTRSRSPGVITGVAVYIPMAVIGYSYFLRTGAVPFVVAACTALTGGSYHFWARIVHVARARLAS